MVIEDIYSDVTFIITVQWQIYGSLLRQMILLCLHRFDNHKLYFLKMVYNSNR